MDVEVFGLAPPPDEMRTYDPDRDPRMDPRPGDMLARGNDIRCVSRRTSMSVEYGFPRKNATRWLSLVQWQVWARDAEVMR